MRTNFFVALALINFLCFTTINAALLRASTGDGDGWSNSIDQTRACILQLYSAVNYGGSDIPLSSDNLSQGPFLLPSSIYSLKITPGCTVTLNDADGISTSFSVSIPDLGVFGWNARIIAITLARTASCIARFYDDTNYGGSYVTLSQNVRKFGTNMNFNDLASSVKTWGCTFIKLFQNGDFGGSSVTYTSDQSISDLRTISMNNYISSVQLA